MLLYPKLLQPNDRLGIFYTCARLLLPPRSLVDQVLAAYEAI